METFQQPDFLEASNAYKVMLIIKGISKVKEMLDSGNPKTILASAGPMRTLILVLQEESQRALEKELLRLRQINQDPRGVDLFEIEEIFGQINRYLFKTYLKDLTFAKPRNPVMGELGKRDRKSEAAIGQ